MAGDIACDEASPSIGADRFLVVGLISAALGRLQYDGLTERFAPWVMEPGAGQAYGNLRQRNQVATLLDMP